MQAVLLAGGLGTRLRPITETIPKCMALIGDKPFLFYLLQLLKRRGMQNIILCIGYLGEQIVEYFGDGENLGLKISYSQEKERLLGTGGALKLAEKLLDNAFFVINGDTYLDINYTSIFQKFTTSNKKALIVASSVNKIERSDLEIQKNLIVSRYDKDTKNNLGYVNAGVLAFKKEVVSGIEPGRAVSLEKEIFPKLIANQDMIAHITEQRFYDIGTFDKLKIFKTSLQGVKQ